MSGRNFGRLPERPKGGDCKSSGIAFGGSNPSPPTRTVEQLVARWAHIPEVTGSSPVCATRPRQGGPGIPGKYLPCLSGGMQTRRLQVSVPERASGFKSRDGHGGRCSAAQAGGSAEYSAP